MNIRKFLLIFILVSVLAYGTYFVLETNKTNQASSLSNKQKALKDRVLFIVISNNYIIPDQFVDLYNQNEQLANTAFSFVFKADKEKLESMSLEEIIVNYGEDYVIEKYKREGEGYGEIVTLSGKEATYDNFKDTLVNLEKKDKKIDILLNLHGLSDSILFYKNRVEKEKIANDLQGIEIGYVYQTICYGGQNMDVWTEIGAEVVSGAKGRNDFVILSPVRFLKNWTAGMPYKKAVEDAYYYESSRFKIIDSLSDKINFNREESKMLFLGDKRFRL